MASKPLCSRCRELSFETLFFGPCVFCNVQEGYYKDVMLYQAPLDLSYDYLKSLATDAVVCSLEVGFDTPEKFSGKQPHIYRKDRMRSGGFDRSNLMPSIFAITNEADGMSHQLGRFVDPNTIDWGHIRRWNSACESHWKDEQDAMASHVSQNDYRSHMRVIDVESACIISCPPRAPYIALSYQWGTDQKLKLKKSNICLLEAPGFFNTAEGSPAQTIRDAMTVVQRLRFRYLWVDALCIIQDSTESIIESVERMDQIYMGARLTIVAAAGKNAYHGLPGVSPTTPRSEAQLRINLQGITIANMLESANGAINFTRWNTRGWTYQERLLSRRLLSFTTSQVYYHCDRGCDFQEQHHFSGDGSNSRYAFADPTARLDFENRNIWEIYAIAIAEYTKRSITNPNDKIRALNGILNQLKEPFGTSFFFGLPVNLFDVALLWKPLGAYNRGNERFPSWSWAGCDGAVLYELVDSMTNMCECVISQADITPWKGNFRLSTNITTERDVPSMSYDGSTWKRHFDEETLEVEYKKIDPSSSARFPRPLPSQPHHEHKDLSRQTCAVLKVESKTAKFWLTDQHSLLAYTHGSKASCKKGLHKLCYLAILDDQQRIAGTIVVDGRTVPNLANKQHKFLALSRSTLYRIDDDPSWDNETKTFRHWNQQQGQTSKPKYDMNTVDKMYTDKPLEAFLADNDAEPNDGFFDRRHFSDQVFWPAINVLLLSEERSGDGVVERVGVGSIHVDAFEPIATLEEVLLG